MSKKIRLHVGDVAFGLVLWMILIVPLSMLSACDLDNPRIVNTQVRFYQRVDAPSGACQDLGHVLFNHSTTPNARYRVTLCDDTGGE